MEVLRVFDRALPVWELVLWSVASVVVACLIILATRRLLRRRGLANVNGVSTLDRRLSKVRQYSNVEVIDIDALVRSYRRRRILLQVVPALAVPMLAFALVWINLPQGQAIEGWTFSNIQSDSMASNDSKNSDDEQAVRTLDSSLPSEVQRAYNAVLQWALNYYKTLNLSR